MLNASIRQRLAIRILSTSSKSNINNNRQPFDTAASIVSHCTRTWSTPRWMVTLMRPPHTTNIIVMRMMRIVSIEVTRGYRIVRLNWRRYRRHGIIRVIAKARRCTWICPNMWPTVRYLTRNTAPLPPPSTMRFVLVCLFMASFQEWVHPSPSSRLSPPFPISFTVLTPPINRPMSSSLLTRLHN